MPEPTARITLRFDRSKLDQIEHAARLCGVTTEDFIREAAVRSAREVLSRVPETPSSETTDPQGGPDQTCRAS